MKVLCNAISHTLQIVGNVFSLSVLLVMADDRDPTIFQAREMEFGIQLLTPEFPFADVFFGRGLDLAPWNGNRRSIQMEEV